MAGAFERTALWMRTLAEQKDDQWAEVRTKLRNSYLSMREKTKELVSLIPSDCKGLTVHDISHLDALWETADLIAGPDFPMNPAEAFIFGAAVLIHDAGMTVAAFPGGLNEITKTTEWTDSVYAFYRTNELPEPSRDAIQNPPIEFREQILFTVLRALHARQAENLISARWLLPSSGDQVCLLESEHFRTAYGRSIGRIARSHHWDIERVNSELRESVGAATDLPGDWTANEKMVACLLRCADAAHIDHRRAPSMLYALSKPKGESDKHWRFQHKLNKATRNGDALLYSSGQDFDVSEASAWWLAFDTIKMVDRELSSSSALLQDIGAKSFAVSRVFGAESPRIFARQVRPNNWQPVEAEIKVTNPAHLAQTLGGRNLYGSGAHAPIRELLQNAVDAIRARRRLEQRPPSWGLIHLTLETLKGTKGDEVWLHVDDSGTGMSERVLVGPLLDFGRSLWNSTLLQEEFPGLESRGIKPIGKFGIGFFSIFMLGQRVKVVSRSYKAGVDATRVLEFSSLSTRPILRNADANELPTDFTTRVSVCIDNLKKFEEPQEHSLRYGRRPARNLHRVLSEQTKKLVAAVDVAIQVDDKVAGTSYTHQYDWDSNSPQNFLNEILADVEQPHKDGQLRMHENLLDRIVNSSGECLGRAALRMTSESGPGLNMHHVASNTSVGGFIYQGTSNFSYVGVLSGDTEDVSRGAAKPNVPPKYIAEWATRQAKLIDPSKFQIYDVLVASHTIIRLGGDPFRCHFAFRRVVSFLWEISMRLYHRSARSISSPPRHTTRISNSCR